MKQRKRTLTLLEVVIAITLLGMVLTGLLTAFHRSLKNNVTAKALKQKVLQIELFQLKVKKLFVEEKKLWLEECRGSRGLALHVLFEQPIDPDPHFSGQLTGQIFVNDRHQLCLMTRTKKGKERKEILLDGVESITFQLFDADEKDWQKSWPEKKVGKPVMVSMKLKWKSQELDFAFFLPTPIEPIVYSGSS